MALSTSVLLEFMARNRSASGIASFNRSVASSTRHIRGLMTSVLAFAGVTGIGYMLKRQAEAIDSMAKLSDRIGIATERLAGLQYGAQIMGVETGTLNKALEIFSRRLGEVQMGTGEAKRVLDMLNLSATQLSQVPLDQALGTIADRIAAVSTQTEKAAAANYLFGRSGQQLLNFFETGSRGMAEFQEFAEKAGLAITRIDAAKVEAANDALARTRLIFTGLFRTTVVELAPYIEAAATAFVNWATEGEGVGEKVTGAFESATQATIALSSEIEILTLHLEAAVGGWSKFKRDTKDTWYIIKQWLKEPPLRVDVLTGGKTFDAYRRPGGSIAEMLPSLPSTQAGIPRGNIKRQIEAARQAAAARRGATAEWFANLKRDAEERARQAVAARRAGISPLGTDGAAEPAISAARKRMEALRAQVREEISLLGRLNEPRQHARMLVEFQAQAAIEYADNTQQAIAATEAFRAELERLEQAESLARIAESIGQAFSTAFEDAILEAKNLNDVMIALSRTIQRAIFQEFVSRPLSMAITGAIGGAIMPAPASAVVAHGGGRIGDIRDRRWVSSSVFKNAPRFHDLAPGEMAVIAQPDEVISRPGEGGSGVQITNNFNLQMIDASGARRFVRQYANDITRAQQAGLRNNVGR